MVTSFAYPSPSYTIVLSASYWLWITLEIWLIARERRDANAVAQDRGSRTVLIVSLSIAVVLGIFAAPVLLPQFTRAHEIRCDRRCDHLGGHCGPCLGDTNASGNFFNLRVSSCGRTNG